LAGFKQMVLMLIAMAVIQVVAGNVLAPALMSGDVGLHPVIIIFSIFFFGACFGGLGMILAVPLMGTLKVIANYIVAAFGSSVEEAPEPGEKTIEEEQLKKELL
ncbi:MAG: AI-2E family transporter, partial [Eubacteriaceae bacterium]|nr:AI-2E family transporter [Eubacteriaceae bacterium]